MSRRRKQDQPVGRRGFRPGRRALQGEGYAGYLTIEISIMVQRRPAYDPAEVAARSFRTLIAASAASGVELEHRGAPGSASLAREGNAAQHFKR